MNIDVNRTLKYGYLIGCINELVVFYNTHTNYYKRLTQVHPPCYDALICYNLTNNDTVFTECLINSLILAVATLFKAKIKLILSELEKGLKILSLTDYMFRKECYMVIAGPRGAPPPPRKTLSPALTTPLT